jgi:transposase InsO family protein
VYHFITSQAKLYQLDLLCSIFKVSRSAYYAWRKGDSHRPSVQKLELAKVVKSIFEEHLARYGARRIQAEMLGRGLQIGRYQIRSLMRQEGLKAIQPRSFVPKTTQTNPNLQRSPNLLLELDEVTQINQVWVGDITYIPLVGSKWCYLATWMDLHSRLIVGWALQDSMNAQLVIRSFRKAIDSRRPPPGLIVHSDGGGQYMDLEFRGLLANKYRQSMTRVDNHYDNAHAESLFSRFKSELIGGGTFINLDDANTVIFEYIEVYYNRKRRHSGINYFSPANFEQQLKNG